MNRESETSTFDLAPDGGRRSRRRRGRRPRRAVVLSGAVAVMAVVGGGYGVAQSMGGGGGDTGAAAEVSSARAADRAPGLPGVPPSEGAAAPSAAASAAPSASPRSASPTASATATEAGKGSGAHGGAEAGSGSGSGSGKDSGTKAGGKSGNESKSAPNTTTNRQAPAAGAPAGGKNGSHVQQVVDMVNAERAKNGCSPVTVNAKLQAAAQGHSDDMAARDYYAHTSPEGKSPGDRMTAAGYRWSTYGENIFKSPKDARTAMDGWMKSSGHRANILNCSFKEIGVGINFSANGPWWTQNFGASS
ncbi:CAP domain-containing protein [Streptomyces cinnamoneus]|uniref:CAP domain-containing protein n=1 Tax=Streptomyces cinnamoneus TaxID=53446 RepID=UPI0033E62BAC